VKRFRLVLYRYRRPVAAVCAACAVFLLAVTLRPTTPQLATVVVAAADLPGGTTLAPGDLRIQEVPVDVVLPGAFTEPDDVVGGVLAVAVLAGEPVTTTRMVSGQSLADGLLAVPVRLAEPALADLLSPGSEIDLVLPSGDTTGRLVAEGVRVIAVPRGPRETGVASAQRTPGSLVVVAADRRTAVALAAAATRTGLGVVMR
jgi:Flp pilus assembly protein CpaB